MSPIRFGVVGSGWRAEFFVRMARLLPDTFTCVGVVTRTAGRGAEVERAWGVPTVRAATELEAPELVVVATPWPVTPDAIRELVARGVPVLAETPPAPDADGLRALWSDVGSSGLVQVAEHSPYMPSHAARIAAVQAGIIGEPTSVQISSTHLYHAVGLIRRILGVGFEEVAVRATTTTERL
ncbi:MAG TPA: Gfo/Idh/MocA family oxidoreductase, partial [Cellulomonas sp.]|nr:Gfo/Idh/MocA family oxidoreductase [Cellulomonas sp.]